MKFFSLNIFVKLYFAWLIFIFLYTEVLSLLHLISRQNIILGNLIFFISFFSFWRKELVHFRIQQFGNLIIFLILALTFIQGFFSAPNTTDSMVYHLPRVMYWVQEKTLYQDTIRNDHDFMAPFAEYLLLHLYLIFNGDRLLFLSQWLAFATSIILSYLIAKKIGAEEKGACFVAALVATLPIGVMQATSTQTDMVTNVLILFSVYFALILVEKPSIRNSLLFSFSMGLGILTKATVVLFLIIPMGILLPIILKKWKQYFSLVLLSFLIIGIVQIRFLDQNLRIYGNISGQKIISGKSGYINELINPQVVFSNLIRNLFLHIPVPFVSGVMQNGIVNVHNIMGIGLNDPRTTYYDTKFSVLSAVFPQEDIAGNPIHLLIILLAGIFLILKKTKFKVNDKKVYLFLLTLISFIIFSAVLRWQPFHSRLQIPFFMLGSIAAVCILFEYNKFKVVLNYFLVPSVTLSLVIIFLNVSKPYVSYKSFYDYVKSFAPPLSDIPQAFFIRNRDRQYFNARYYWYNPYKEVVKNLAKRQLTTKTVAFQLMDGFEYPLWLLLKDHGINLRVIPEPKKSEDTIIISTSVGPLNLEEYQTDCIKTEIDYGYACISTKFDNISKEL